MSSRYASVDEVRVLSGGVDLFELLYARARAAYPRGIWVEAFGAVKGASIIELIGDRHRESVREATLSQMSATVFHDGETPEIRSVATLTWREKRNPRSLTGFLASALAVHVTLRIREIEWVTGAPEDAVTTIGLSGPVMRPAAKTAKAAPKSSPASKPAPKAAPPSAPEELDLFTSAAPRQEPTPTPTPAAGTAGSPGWDTLEEASTAAASDDAFGWDALAAATAPSSAGGAGAAPEKAAQAQKPARKPEADAQLLDAAWGEVAQVSLEVGLRPATAASALKRGEVLVHPTLGSCTILSVVSESVVMVKPKGQPSKKISLKPFEIFATPKSGVYELERR